MHHTDARCPSQRLLSCATGPIEASFASPFCNGFVRKSRCARRARLFRICSTDAAFADTTDGMFSLSVINGFTM
jgi:hypothetical protein